MILKKEKLMWDNSICYYIHLLWILESRLNSTKNTNNNFFCIKKILYICNQTVYLRIIAIYYPSHKSKNDETNRNNS